MFSFELIDAVEKALCLTVHRLTSETALDLLEATNPARLIEHADLMEHLADEQTPFHTLDELADLMEQVLNHLRHDREFILKSGYPLGTSVGCPWLEWQLVTTYQLKAPLQVVERSDGG